MSKRKDKRRIRRAVRMTHDELDYMTTRALQRTADHIRVRRWELENAGIAEEDQLLLYDAECAISDRIYPPDPPLFGSS